MQKLIILITLIIGLVSSCEKNDDGDLPEITTIAPYDIGAETATAGGAITSNGGSRVTARGVCWDTIAAPTIADDKTEDGTGIGNFTSSVIDLIAGKTYYLRAYATNKAGTAYGNEESFSTSLPGVFIDSRDGNTYRTVTIGSQVWMAENLKYLPEVHSNDEFDHRNSPGYGVFGYNGSNLAEAKSHPNYNSYGVLYNWDAAMSACPSGWRLPSATEWDALENFIKNDGLVDAGWEGNALKATRGWNCGVPGTDNYGFTALAGGVRSADGLFYDTGLYSNWWTSTVGSNDCCAAYRSLVCTYGMISSSSGGNKFGGFYVRCIRD